jgi:hypothetical protein
MLGGDCHQGLNIRAFLQDPNQRRHFGRFRASAKYCNDSYFAHFFIPYVLDLDILAIVQQKSGQGKPARGQPFALRTPFVSRDCVN